MTKIHSNILILSLVAILFSFSSYSQADKNYKVACVGFYNLENLFDTINDPLINDDDFTPAGSFVWNSTKYVNKLNNISVVIEDLGKDVSPDGCAVIGVCEVENRLVLEDLVKEEKIKNRNYKIIHIDSPDKRGIDVGLLYQEKYFKPTNTASHKLIMLDKPDFYTRNQLVVSGLMDGDKVSFIVAHWPSRGGGQAASEPSRIAAAKLGREIIDSLLKEDPNAKIVLMGDLNDDPVNKSVRDYLRARTKLAKVKSGDLYNVMYDKFKLGDCTLAYQDAWNLFDQLIISQGLMGIDESTYIFHKSYVYSKDYLKQKEGNYKGYPKRTHAGGLYLNGYSDHFPVYMVLKKEVK